MECGTAMTSRLQGNAGVGMAIAYFTSQKYIVSIPLSDTQDYDLVVDMGSGLKKVQVKTASSLQGNKNYTVTLKQSKHNTKGNTIKNFDEYDCEYVFISVIDGTMYLIPRSEITARSAIVLYDKYDKFKVTF
ncbi:group I intron-associated PD-(D/E)XK endonuclease [Bacillus cereus]|uniref:group I intron-associated PD-(D/E)XK endonuclease n=2 Tax=Bacillus cereus group TaxID=86661 RepID=UPI0012F7AC7C|nr:group I intron-associated PD-(D/E)XK endonuclease [Bacillus cereus]